PGGEQRRCDSGKSGYRVRARIVRLAQYEDIDGPRLTHGYAGAHADHLFFDPRFQFGLDRAVAATTDRNRPELREVDGAVSIHRQFGVVVLIAIDLHFEHVIGSDDIVDGHRR